RPDARPAMSAGVARHEPPTPNRVGGAIARSDGLRGSGSRRRCHGVPAVASKSASGQSAKGRNEEACRGLMLGQMADARTGPIQLAGSCELSLADPQGNWVQMTKGWAGPTRQM